jgi:hypothetical protein
MVSIFQSFESLSNYFPCGLHLWIVKTFDPLNSKSPSVFDPHVYGFNILTLTNIGFGSKVLIETRRIVLLGKQYYTLNGPNYIFLNLPICVFSPLGNHKT